MCVSKKRIPLSELIRLNKTQVYSLNLAALQKESFTAFCISFIVFCISCFYSSELWMGYRFHTALLSIVSIAIFLLCLFDRQQMLPLSTVVSFVYSCFLLFYFSVFHYFSAVPIPIVCFYSLVILMPIIFFSNPYILYPILGTFSAFHIALAYASQDPYFAITVINTVTVFFCSFLLSVQLQRTKMQTIDTGRIIEEQRDTDMLTGLPNRTKLMNELEKSILDEDKNLILGIFMLDIDLFKKYNDTYGHYAGDKCLKAVGTSLQTFAQQTGIDFFRYGGEEFIGIVRKKNSTGKILTNATDFDYKKAAQNLIKTIHDLEIPCCSNIDPFVTISAGYAVQQQNATLSIEDLISRADWALYQSKSNGRNQYTAWTESTESLAQIKEPDHILTKSSKVTYHSVIKTFVNELQQIRTLLKNNCTLAKTTNIRSMSIIFSALTLIGAVMTTISYSSDNTAWNPYRMPYTYLLVLSTCNLLITTILLPHHVKNSFLFLRILITLYLPFIFYERFFTNTGATDFPFFLFCILYTTILIDNRLFFTISVTLLCIIFSAMRIYFFGFDGTALFSLAFILFISIITGNASCYTKLSLFENNRLEKMQSDIDILTGLPNRRKLFEELGKSERITAVYMADIDFFKQFNDKNGHLCGDDCLRKIGEAFTSASLLTGIDFFRYGGEEFTGIVRSKNLHGYTMDLSQFPYDENAEMILNEIRSLNIPFCPALSPRVTISCGYAVDTAATPQDSERLIEQADEALYRAKESGRNQAAKYQPSD